MITIGQKYRHFKGKIVEVIALGKHSETLEDMVVYKHDSQVWIRPLEMFLSTEDITNREDNVTKQTYRFELIKENEK